MDKRLSYVFAGVIAVVLAITFSTQFDPKLHISGDNAVYLTLARNMADGHGYRAVGTDGQYHPASHFPPGYSFVLSVFMRLGVDSLIFFKVLNGVFLLASLLLLYLIVKGVTGKPALAFSAVLLAVFSPQTLGFATIAMSEMCYMFFITAGFYAVYRYSGRPAYAGSASPKACRPDADGGKIPEGGPASGRPYCFLRDGWFWTAAVAIAAGYYTRSVAMSAIGAVLVFLLFARQWKQAAVYAAATVAFLLPWSLRNAAHGIQSRYFGTIMTVNPWRPEQGTVSSVGEMAEKMVRNFDETVIKGFREILFPFSDYGQGTPSGFLSVLAGLTVLAVVLYGAWKMDRLRWLFIAYIIFNIGLFMLWHGGNGSRYVTPIAPVLFVCFYTGVYYIADRLLASARMSAPSWLPYAFLLMILPTLGPLQAQAEAARYPYPPAYGNYFRLAAELDRQAPAGTVVVARKPDLFNYHAPRLVAVNYRYTTDPRELLADLLEKNARYVVLEQLGYSSTPLYLLPAIQEYPEVFPVVWRMENPDTYLLEFNAGAARQILGEPR